MTLQSSGQISMVDINVERNVINPTTEQASMDDLTGVVDTEGGYPGIAAEPDNLTDWYSYEYIP